jgi:hypothetical protein
VVCRRLRTSPMTSGRHACLLQRGDEARGLLIRSAQTALSFLPCTVMHLHRAIVRNVLPDFFLLRGTRDEYSWDCRYYMIYARLQELLLFAPARCEREQRYWLSTILLLQFYSPNGGTEAPAFTSGEEVPPRLSHSCSHRCAGLAYTSGHGYPQPFQRDAPSV